MKLEDKAIEMYPEATVNRNGKSVTEFFTVDLKCSDNEHSNTFKLKRTTNYDSTGKVSGIPEMKFEIDNTLMRLRLFGAIHDEIFYKDERGNKRC